MGLAYGRYTLRVHSLSEMWPGGTSPSFTSTPSLNQRSVAAMGMVLPLICTSQYPYTVMIELPLAKATFSSENQRSVGHPATRADLG